MANYNVSSSTASASSAQQVATDKVRVASTTDIYFTSSSSNTTAAANTNPIILAGAPERSVYVGAGNYFSVLAVSANGKVSVTELGNVSGVL